MRKPFTSKTEINGKEQSFRGNEKYYLSKDGNKLIFEQIQTFPLILIPEHITGTNLFFAEKVDEE